MKTPFDVFFKDKKNDRTIDINYLKENKFSARVVIDTFKLKDLKYFDEITGKIPHVFYKLYHAEWGLEESTFTSNSLDELYSKIRDHIFEDMIIEYIGKNIFIWNIESDCYLIFGKKEMINLIGDVRYSYETAKKNIINTKNEEERNFFINFYNKYNVSFE